MISEIILVKSRLELGRKRHQ